MIDMESLRNEMLIEERQNYENDFISIADIMKSEELDYYTGPQFEVYFEKTLESEAPNLDDFDYSFEFEDRLIQQRDEILIKEHEAYEKNNFEDIDLDLIVDDIFDHQIESFKEQVKSPGQNYITLTNLLRLADMNYHPDAIKFIKSVIDLRREYENVLRKVADGDIISEDNFRQFFYDVSTCVANDNDFTQILRALGYK